jgi:hypothetical protein
MCDRCAEIREKIVKGRRFATGIDANTEHRLKEFVVQLESEISALEARPEHKSERKK